MHTIPHIPFKILALAPFLGAECPTWSQAPIKIDLSDPGQAMAELGPGCIVPIPSSLYSEDYLEIGFKKLKDFYPDTLIQTNPVLRNLLDIREYIRETPEGNISTREINTRLSKWPGFSPVQDRTEPIQEKSGKSSSIDRIFEMVAVPSEDHGTTSGLGNIIPQIDTMLEEVLGYVFQDKEYRTLERSWRGLNLLLQHLMSCENVVVEIVPVSMDSLVETVNALTTELIDDLPSLIIVDLPMDNSPRSMEYTEIIARFSETLLIPAITWMSPGFLNISHWYDIKKLSFLPHYLEEPPYARWQTFRKSSSAKWLAATCNRVLGRYPYGKDNKLRLLSFKENDPLWLSPVWAVASLIGISLAKTGWPGQFTHWQDISLEDLALDMTNPDKPIPTEADFNRDRIDQFIRSGIIPILPMQGKDIAFIPNETTVGGSSFCYQLLLSEITQLVLWCKDHLEKTLKGEELEMMLRQVFSAFWEQRGHSTPESLEISVSQPDPDDRTPVRITLEPPKSTLPSREKVEMQFFW